LQPGKQSRATKLHDEVYPKRGKACANDLQLGKQSRASKLHDEVNPKRGKACANDLQLGKQSEAVETQLRVWISGRRGDFLSLSWRNVNHGYMKIG
jgi:hypothetical protein